MERFCFTPADTAETRCAFGQRIGHRIMFDSKEKALEHRDAVVQMLTDALGEAPWHTHPVLDGCTVRILEDDADAVRAACDEEGFPVESLGETGDWVELKVKP